MDIFPSTCSCRLNRCGVMSFLSLAVVLADRVFCVSSACLSVRLRANPSMERRAKVYIPAMKQFVLEFKNLAGQQKGVASITTARECPSFRVFNTRAPRKQTVDSNTMLLVVRTLELTHTRTMRDGKAPAQPKATYTPTNRSPVVPCILALIHRSQWVSISGGGGACHGGRVGCTRAGVGVFSYFCAEGMDAEGGASMAGRERNTFRVIDDGRARRTEENASVRRSSCRSRSFTKRRARVHS